MGKRSRECRGLLVGEDCRPVRCRLSRRHSLESPRSGGAHTVQQVRRWVGPPWALSRSPISWEARHRWPDIRLCRGTRNPEGARLRVAPSSVALIDALVVGWPSGPCRSQRPSGRDQCLRGSPSSRNTCRAHRSSTRAGLRVPGHWAGRPDGHPVSARRERLRRRLGALLAGRRYVYGGGRGARSWRGLPPRRLVLTLARSPAPGAKAHPCSPTARLKTLLSLESYRAPLLFLLGYLGPASRELCPPSGAGCRDSSRSGRGWPPGRLAIPAACRELARRLLVARGTRGVGIREATLTALLGPSIGTGVVVTAALLGAGRTPDGRRHAHGGARLRRRRRR